MAKKIKGQKFGNWIAKKQLGQGGNGEVWLASDPEFGEVAIKFLTNLEGKRGEKVYARFRDEVSVIHDNQDIDGLLPILECHLPETLNKEPPWYAMPVAESLDNQVERLDFEMTVRCILEVGKTLTELHGRSISHRDIKPANILVKDNKFYLSDFGLADFPEKEDLTKTKERVGARWTIAPEMERGSKDADSSSADVYSLAKTLWILLTGRQLGFEGQYRSSSINGLTNVKAIGLSKSTDMVPGSDFGALYIKPLEDLLTDSTNDDPSQRPSITQFVERIESWTQIHKNFRKRNPLQWQDIQQELFPRILPREVAWENIEDMMGILNILSSQDNLNHMLLPDRGGVDLLKASLGNEQGTIELHTASSVYIVRPNRLKFQAFGYDKEWNYFRLETGGLAPTGIVHSYLGVEVLVEIEESSYVGRNEWEIDREEAKKFPSKVRFVKRYIQGDFLILQKTSMYNRSAYTYDGSFNQMSPNDFRDYMDRKVQIVRTMRDNPEYDNLAQQKGMSLDKLIFALLDGIFREEWLEQSSTS